MSKRIFLILFMLWAAGAVYSQSAISISGSVTNEDAIPIPRASVYILNTNSGTLTDNTGHFDLQGLTPGDYILSVSAAGYASINKKITTGENSMVNVVLTRSAVHLDEVVVTAQKREEPLQKLPFSISALTSTDVSDYRLWNNSDITAIIPNLYSANPGDGRNVTSIRGIATTAYNPAVATYIDGVNQFDLDTYIPLLFDVERIEVLRGPQGTLYGRSAMGGVINIITKKPDNQTHINTELDFGNYDRQRLSLSFQTPLIKDKLFLGLAGLYNHTNGFYTNDFNNSHYDKQHSFIGNYYLRYLASKRWELTLNAKHNNNVNGGPFPLVVGVQEAFEHPYHLNQNAISTMADNTYNASFSANYSGPSVNFSSQTAWQQNKRIYRKPIDGDFSPIDGVTIINDYGSKWNRVGVFTQEFRLTSPASVSSKWNWTTGLYFFYQYDPVKQATHLGENGDLMGGEKNTAVLTTSEGNNFGSAVYGQATYRLTDKLSLTGGIRYDYEHTHQNALSQYLIDPNPQPVADIQQDTSAKASFNAFSPKISLSYQLTDNNMVYVVYSRGFRSGGLTEVSSDPSEPPLVKFNPEYSNNYEVGTKNDFWNRRFQFNVAVFYTLTNRAQIPVLLLPDAFTVTKNAGNLRSIGAETEIKIAPVRGMEVDYNFGYTHSRFTSNAVLKTDNNNDPVNLKDKWQIFSPKTTSSLAVQYAFPVFHSPGLNLSVRGEWMNLGSQYFDLANTIRQSAHSVFNARIGIDAKKFGIFLWGRNLAAKKYIAYAYDFGAIHLGDPRTYGVSLIGRF